MPTDLYAHVMSRLESRKATLAAIARGSGVPEPTLKKIALGYTKNPGVQHVQRLADYFSRIEADATGEKGVRDAT